MFATIRQAFAIVWRSLRTMRTALVLLLLVALASVAGSLVPQEGASEIAIQRMEVAHPLRATMYRAVGLFDVFGSWWFTALYVLLLVSLVACVIPRTRAYARVLRAPMFATPDIAALRAYASTRVDSAPDVALQAARKVLRRKGFRVKLFTAVDGTAQLAGQKGIAREGGSLCFHWAILLILVGVIWGRGTGFTGIVGITEGTTWTEAHANFEGNIREGRFFNEDHSGVALRVDDFTAAYRADGSPEAFITDGELFDSQGASLGTVRIQPNQPAAAEGVRFYQNAYGYAPIVTVAAGDGRGLADAPVQMEQPTPKPGDPPTDPRSRPWHGFVRLPSLQPQVAIRLQLLPDPEAAAAGGVPLGPNHPVLLYWVYEGDLQLSNMRPANQTDITSMKEVGSGFLPMDQVDVVKLPGVSGAAGALTVGFPELREYTVLQVVRDRGTGIMLLAAILILGGLFMALGSTRRRVWVQAQRDGNQTVLEAGGYALQRRAQFDEGFVALFEALAGGKTTGS